MSRRSARAKGKRSFALTPIQEMSEAALRTRSKGTKRGRAQAFSLAWDETEALGITADMRRSGPGMLSDQDRKETLYQSYLNSVWISACADVIAKRITSGGMILELTEKGEENEEEYRLLHDFLHYINDDEDFLHLIRSIATDMLIYGEAYLEIVYRNGVPFSLHKVDCITMNYNLDKYGNIIGYEQHMVHSTESIKFEPDQIIRWWLADPKASKKALSPVERVLGPIDSEVHMADWVRSFFRKGARPPFWIKYPGSKDDAERFVTWLRENYTGQANAHVPLVLYDEAELHEIGKGAVDMDFVKGRELSCREILAAYQVPPALVGLIESGNIGGGTGESQEKSFQYNACDPLRQLIFEKFNDRIIRYGFKSKNYHVNTRYGDYRSDDIITKNQDIRIRNGTVNVNEARAELGFNSVDGGEHNVIVTVREIVPISSFHTLQDEHDQHATLDIALKQEQMHKLRSEAHPDVEQLQDKQNTGMINQENPDEFEQHAGESVHDLAQLLEAYVQKVSFTKDTLTLPNLEEQDALYNDLYDHLRTRIYGEQGTVHTTFAAQVHATITSIQRDVECFVQASQRFIKESEGYESIFSEVSTQASFKEYATIYSGTIAQKIMRGIHTIKGKSVYV